MKKFFIACLLSITIFSCKAQPPDSAKIFDHYIGLQANQLFRQLINLNTGSTLISNPYLLTYTVFYKKCNLGLEGGFGYDFHHVKDNLSPSNQDSKINDVFYRYGIVKNFMLGKKWEASAGLDYVGSYQLDKTFTFLVTDFNTQTDSTASISSSLIKSKGAGLQLRLGFHLNPHIMLTTEGTFYYLVSKEKNSVLVSETFTSEQFPESNFYTLSATNSSTENSDFKMTVPVAIFLTVKF